METQKAFSVHLEEGEEAENIKPNDDAAKDFDGAVHLAGPGDIIYLIPSPSADPRDPLNLSLWGKWTLMALVCLFSSIGLTSVGGLGGLLGILIPGYIEEGRTVADITHLMTFPTLFMGIGNLIGMPLALAIGRRPVFLGSCLIIVLGAVLCAFQDSYEWHLGARMILGLAAGQSEALCPLMVQEIFFLHERALYQMYFTAIGNIITSVLSLLTSYIGAAIGLKGWYGLLAGFAGLVFILSIFFAPETKYERPLSAYQGLGPTTDHFIPSTDTRDESTPAAPYTPQRTTTNDKRVFDLVNYQPRTLASNMRLFSVKPDWQEGFRTIKRMGTVIFFPDVLWAFLLNGLTLGINIAMSTTYGSILGAPPYSWAQENISFATGGQIVVSFIALPVLGWGSDWIMKKLAQRNNGVHEPQYRLVPLVFPTCIGVLAAILYGQAASHPDRFHWFSIVFSLNAFYFAFVGANQVGIVYSLDAYPTRSGPVLVIICAVRGILSFGTSYAVQPFIDLKGYGGAFLIYGILTGVIGSIGILIYIFSRRIRRFCSQFALHDSGNKPSYS